MSKDDYYGARQDYLTEMVDYTLQQLHEIGECKGPPECGECLDEQEREHEELQEQERERRELQKQALREHLESENRRALAEILQNRINGMRNK